MHVLDCLEDDERSASSATANDGGEVRCHFCPEVFKSREDVMNHRKAVHPTTIYQVTVCVNKR